MATSVYLGGGGGGTPSSPTDSIQFNNAGSFGGNAALSFDPSTLTFTVESKQDPLDGSSVSPALAGLGAGNVDNGVHRYGFTIVTTSGETTLGAPTNPVTVTNKTVNGQVTFNIPAAGLFGRSGIVYPINVNLYRTKAGGSTYFLVPDSPFGVFGQTAYVDNNADASLGVNPPVTNTAIEPVFTTGPDGAITPALSPSSFGSPVMVLDDAGQGSVGFTPIGSAGAGIGFFLQAGIGANGHGGVLSLASGDGSFGTNANGGTLQVFGGQGTGSGNGGEIDITSGSAGIGGAGAGAFVVITAGDGDGAGAGGSITLTAGGSGSGTPGDIVLTSTDFIKMTGPTLFPGNGSIATGQTNGNSLILRAYDVDGATYKTFLTLTSANTPDMTIGPAAGATVTLQASTYKSSDGSTGVTAGPFTTISSITVKNGLVTALTGS